MVMRSLERGQIRENNAALNSLQQPSNCRSRAVRDLYSLLTSKQNQKLRDKEKASRIEQYRSVVKNDKFAIVD